MNEDNQLTIYFGSGRNYLLIQQSIDLCTRYPLRLGDHRGSVEYDGLPDTSTHEPHWELNPRPSDLESKALFTWWKLRGDS